jgi:hypothetical protein
MTAGGAHFFVVTNQQLYLAIGIPFVLNASLVVVLIAMLSAKIDAKFDAVYARLDAIDKRFDDMRDLWRAELRRVEEVLDARLKHLESR